MGGKIKIFNRVLASYINGILLRIFGKLYPLVFWVRQDCVIRIQLAFLEKKLKTMSALLEM